ncbi:MAG: FixH family protein [Deltaproteobacteria bacterium]|nr:FixH family protein [Deltaproteobacteria bacterium]
MKQSKKSPWPFIITAFFSVILIVNIYLVYAAAKSYDGLVFANYYERGLKYNDVIQQEKRQRELGWNLDLSVGLSEKNKVLARIFLTDKNELPIDSATAKLEFIRPTSAGKDTVIELDNTGKGVYAGEVILPSSGNWDVKIMIAKGEDRFEETKRIRIDE